MGLPCCTSSSSWAKNEWARVAPPLPKSNIVRMNCRILRKANKKQCLSLISFHPRNYCCNLPVATVILVHAVHGRAISTIEERQWAWLFSCLTLQRWTACPPRKHHSRSASKCAEENFHSFFQTPRHPATPCVANTSLVFYHEPIPSLTLGFTSRIPIFTHRP